MAPVMKTASRVAWSGKRQSDFGTPLAVTEMNRFLRLRDPLVVQEILEHWSDRGMIGSGHDWETERGLLKRHVEIEIPEQALPVDFAAFLIALFFAGENAVQDVSGAYVHTASFPDLQSVPESPVTTLAIHEDGQDWFVQDVACTKLTVSGSGSERLNVGATLIGTRIGGPLTSYSWPTASAQRYLYNYAGSFGFGGVERHPQLRSFNLALESGINLDLAWRKTASASERIYPSVWPLTPERRMGLSATLVAEPGDLTSFRTAYADSTWSAASLSVLGEPIPGSDPQETDSLVINVPRAAFTGIQYEYGDGVLSLSLDIEGRYDSALGGPLSIVTTEGSTEEFLVG